MKRKRNTGTEGKSSPKRAKYENKNKKNPKKKRTTNAEKVDQPIEEGVQPLEEGVQPLEEVIEREKFNPNSDFNFGQKTRSLGSNDSTVTLLEGRPLAEKQPFRSNYGSFQGFIDWSLTQGSDAEEVDNPSDVSHTQPTDESILSTRFPIKRPSLLHNYGRNTQWFGENASTSAENESYERPSNNIFHFKSQRMAFPLNKWSYSSFDSSPVFGTPAPNVSPFHSPNYGFKSTFGQTNRQQFNRLTPVGPSLSSSGPSRTSTSTDTSSPFVPLPPIGRENYSSDEFCNELISTLKETNRQLIDELREWRKESQELTEIHKRRTVEAIKELQKELTKTLVEGLTKQ